jgi:dTMP kinase
VTTRGKFIVFEGGEGCGKTTQSQRLADRLGAVLTRQPGGTALGVRLRQVLLSPGTGEIEPRAEALLMAADRAQHTAELIRPALDAGSHVVCDRYVGSSVAYQGFGRGLDPDGVAALSGWATDNLWPDLVVLLTVPAEVSAARLGPDLDRFESAGDDFHRRVAEGFITQARNDPARWVVIDGTASIDEVAAAVDAAVAERMAL